MVAGRLVACLVLYQTSMNTDPTISAVDARAAARIALRDEPRVAPATSTVRFFDSELLVFPGVRFPLRSMLVESPTKAILISPVGTRAELVAVDGKPCVIAEPSLLHYKRLAQSIQKLAPRELWGPPGFAEKLPEFGDASVFGADPWPHDDLLSFTLIEGAPFRNEIVFFHRASRTLYTADLVFGIVQPSGILTPLVLRALGIGRTFGAAKLWSHWIKDPAAFRRSIDRVMGWPFDRIAMAHGEIVEGNARAKLFGALRERGLI
jgi:hypothetical protein